MSARAIPFRSRPDVVCLSHLRWDFVFQRPNHLMRACAQWYRTFFVEEAELVEGPSYVAVREVLPGLHVVTPKLEQALDRAARNETLKNLLAHRRPQLLRDESVGARRAERASRCGRPAPCAARRARRASGTPLRRLAPDFGDRGGGGRSRPVDRGALGHDHRALGTRHRLRGRLLLPRARHARVARPLTLDADGLLGRPAEREFRARPALVADFRP